MAPFAHTGTPAPLAEEALRLAASLSPDEDRQAAVGKLAAAGDRPELERAQQELVRRLSARTDDFQATVALNLVNKALAKVGWPDAYSWKHRRKP